LGLSYDMVQKKRAKAVVGSASGGSSGAKTNLKAAEKASRHELNIVTNLEVLVMDDARWSAEDEIAQSLFKLDESLANLRRAQAERDLVLRPRTPERFSDFFDWLNANGMDTSDAPYRIGLVEDDDTDNATLFATQDIREGELITTIPSSVMMTTETALGSAIGNFISKVLPLRSAPSVTLALHVLAEALDESSRFSPYIGILPSSFSIPYSMPFTAEHFLALRPSAAHVRAIKTTRSQVVQYTKLYNLLSRDPAACSALPLERFTYRNFEWAISVVMTRQNSLVSDGSGQSPLLALVPVWDLCNHAQGRQTTSVLLDQASGLTQVECTAMRNFSSGDPITIFYGQRSNVDLLLYSGFVQPENPHDLVDVAIPFEGNDKRTRIQKTVSFQRLLQQGKFEGARLERGSQGEMTMVGVVGAGGEISRSLSAMCRISVMPSDPDQVASASKLGLDQEAPDREDFREEDLAVALLKRQIIRKRSLYRAAIDRKPCSLGLADRLVKALLVEEDSILARASANLDEFGLS
jgi:SET domain